MDVNSVSGTLMALLYLAVGALGVCIAVAPLVIAARLKHIATLLEFLASGKTIPADDPGRILKYIVPPQVDATTGALR